MDTTPDSIALDTTGDGTVDKVVPIEDKDKYIVGEDKPAVDNKPTMKKEVYIVGEDA